MLRYLHVKNLALIDEIEVEFKDGLNILTGETGAGKSIILGSVNLALGEKFSPSMLRNHEIPGLVELIFEEDDKRILDQLKKTGFLPEEGLFVLTRKLNGSRGICKINGETVSQKILKEVSALLIDIHGQHDSQLLRYRKNHLRFLDSYAGDEMETLLEETSTAYKEYKNNKKILEESVIDEQGRQRELSLIEYEIKEIEDANIKEGEDIELEEQYEKMRKGQQYVTCVRDTYYYTNEASGGNASDLLSRAIRNLSPVTNCDEQGSALYNQLVEIDSLLNDFNRELSEYEKSFEFDEEDFRYTEDRLDLINRLKSKYGNTIEEIYDYLKERTKRLEELNDYERFIEDLKAKYEKSKKALDDKCNKLSVLRNKIAGPFAEKITKSLKELNFNDAIFEVKMEKLDDYTEKGIDSGEFYVSTNIGEPLKPLGDTASGGELSRIMLAIKSVAADKEDTPTLIFDEIDAGISGITAGKVADKLHEISADRQVICITHLPQIAARSDAHYLIKKESLDERTCTDIKLLNNNESVDELARLLGGDKITDTIMESAREMKEINSPKSI